MRVDKLKSKLHLAQFGDDLRICLLLSDPRELDGDCVSPPSEHFWELIGLKTAKSPIQHFALKTQRASRSQVHGQKCRI